MALEEWIESVRVAILIQKKFLTGEHSESMRGKRVEGKKVIFKKKNRLNWHLEPDQEMSWVIILPAEWSP